MRHQKQKQTITTDSIRIAGQLRTMRKSLGMTQTQAGIVFGVTLWTIARIERHVRPMSPDMYDMLTRVTLVVIEMDRHHNFDDTAKRSALLFSPNAFFDDHLPYELLTSMWSTKQLIKYLQMTPADHMKWMHQQVTAHAT